MINIKKKKQYITDTKNAPIKYNTPKTSGTNEIKLTNNYIIIIIETILCNMQNVFKKALSMTICERDLFKKKILFSAMMAYLHDTLVSHLYRSKFYYQTFKKLEKIYIRLMHKSPIILSL